MAAATSSVTIIPYDKFAISLLSYPLERRRHWEKKRQSSP